MSRFKLTLLPNVIRRTFFTSTESIKPDLDLDRFQSNKQTIQQLVYRRKGKGDVELVSKLAEALKAEPGNDKLKSELLNAALSIPNDSHPESVVLNGLPKVIKEMGPQPPSTAKPFNKISKSLGVCESEGFAMVCGPRSYYLLDDLARLEGAIIDYAVDNLLSKGFSFMSVPDILDRSVIEYCGMETKGLRNQVYKLSEEYKKDLCLSGTAEMGLAGYFANTTLPLNQLPLKIASISRCYRAETSKVSEEKGIYRVHEFTKVEMFGVTSKDQSEALLEEFRLIQEDLFVLLNLRIRTLEMPESELGAQAYRKYDVEGFMPGKNAWGELSSASNCTDYQSRRLNIRAGQTFAHTINGTACAIPRLLLAIVETHTNADGSVNVPDPLQRYLNSKVISKSRVPSMKPYKQLPHISNYIVRH